MAGLLTSDPVAQTVRRWAAEPFVWGTSDCAMSVMGHVERVTGRTWTRDWHWSSRIGALRTARTAGGFLATFSFAVQGMGCIPTEAPARDDIGIVELPEVGPAAALCLGSSSGELLWACKGEREVIVIPAPVLRAWTIGRQSCPRP